MAKEERRARWVLQEVTHLERWGREVAGEELAWRSVLDEELRAMDAEAWAEAETEDRRRQLEQARLEAASG